MYQSVAVNYLSRRKKIKLVRIRKPLFFGLFIYIYVLIIKACLLCGKSYIVTPPMTQHFHGL